MDWLGCPATPGSQFHMAMHSSLIPRVGSQMLEFSVTGERRARGGRVRVAGKEGKSLNG